MDYQIRAKQARVEYLKRTQSLFIQLAEIRMNQTIKYLYNHLNNTLERIIHETEEEKIILKQIDEIFDQITKEFNL